MNNISYVEAENPYTQETIVNVVITHEDGSITGMLKSTYDEMIAKQEEPTNDPR